MGLINSFSGFIILHQFFSTYDSSPCPSSSTVFRRLLSFFFFCPLSLKVFQEYIGRERERATQKTYRAKNEKEPIQHKKEGNSCERKMKNGTLESRERELGFYVIPIEIDFHGKVYPSLVLHGIQLVYLSDVPFDAILNRDINHSM